LDGKNEGLRSRIVEGELKGLSIEGYFVDRFQKMNERKPKDEEILQALLEILNENQTNSK
jgi:hypothetical protein